MAVGAPKSAPFDGSTRSRATAPAILLVGWDDGFAAMLRALCDTLGIALVHADSMPRLRSQLHELRPIGIACRFAGPGAASATVADACQQLRAIAAYDRQLPMLLLSDPDPETLGSLDALAALCGLTDLHRLTAPPLPRDVVAFLARAGRRSGDLALMAV